MREFDLQAAFPRLRAFAEDLQNERGAIQHLRIPCFLQIALLHGRELGVDDNDVRFQRARLRADLVHLARTDQRRGHRPRKRHDVLSDDFQADGRREADSFGKTGFRVAQFKAIARLALDMNDERAGAFALRNLKAGFAQAFSIAGAVSCSMS